MADSGKRNAFPRMSRFKLKTRPVSTEGNCLSPSMEEAEICERLKAEDFIVTKTYRYGFPDKPTCISYDPVQSILAIGTYDGSLKILGKLGVECHVKHESNSPVQSLIFLVNEGALISNCPDDILNLWNLRQAQPVIVQSLKFRRETICAVHLPFQSKWLYVGTEKGNVHIVNVEKFQVSGYIIYWNKCVEVRCKSHPGRVVHISENPVDPNKLLIGYDTGVVVVWSLRDKVAEQRCYCPKESFTTAQWLNDGKQFMCGHMDGSVTVWSLKSIGKPLESVMPHAKAAKERGCGPIYKLNWIATSSGEPLVIFSGGSPSGKKRRGLTLKQGRHTKTLYADTIIDFVCLTNTPWAADVQDPKAVIAITPDRLLAFDIVTSLTKVPVFPVPYTFDIHEAAVTSMDYVADCPPDLIRDLLAVGGGNKKKPLRREDSRQAWPVVGGVRSGSAEESSLSLIITGHADGTVKFWEASSAVMSCLHKLLTNKLFEKDKVKSSSEGSDGSSESTREPPTLDSQSDEQDSYAVQQVQLCVRSRSLVVCGSVHVLLFQFSLTEQTLELVQLDFNLTFERCNDHTSSSPEDSDSSPTEAKDSFPTTQSVSTPSMNCKIGVYKRQPGFQAELCCVTGASTEARPINNVTHSTQFGMLSISNGMALALVDTIQKKLVTVLSAQDVNGLVKSPFSSQSSTVATPVTPGAPVSFMISETGGPVDLAFELESTDKTKKQKPPRPPPPLTRGMSKKGSSDSDGSDSADGIFRSRTFSSSNAESAPDAIQCAKFALTFTKKHDNLLCPCLWVGTVLGSVFVVAINLPPGESRLIQPVLTMVTGTVFPLKSGMILSLSILNKEGHLFPSPFQFWKEIQAKNYCTVSPRESTEKHFAVICAEKEARVYQLPPSSHSSHTPKHKVSLMEDSAVVLRAEVVLIQGSSCLLCLNCLGKLMTFSLPSLTSLMNAECSFLLTDYKFLRTLTFSENGQASILCSSSEVQRFSFYNKISTTDSNDAYSEVKESTGTFFKAMEVPECITNKPSFFGTLFSTNPSPLDREQLFGPESGKASYSVAEYVPGPGMEKLQETSSELASAMQKNKMALMERGRKLERLDEKTEQMASQAKSFSDVSHQVMLKFKDKKWYQM